MNVNSSFYVAGGSLRSDTKSYVERDADEELYSAISRGEIGRAHV